jgi:hypothetical protein
MDTMTLLRGGASNVIIKTRFHDDALRSYNQEPDFDVWASPFQMVQSDLTSVASIDHKIRRLHLSTQGKVQLLL